MYVDINRNKLYDQVQQILDQEVNMISNLSNIACIIYSYMQDINYVGFYTVEDNNLIVGPFQGKAIRTKIKIGDKNGICSTAAFNMQPLIVDNVKSFYGYIEFEPLTKSKIVLPIMTGKDIFGLIALESETVARFTMSDQDVLQVVVDLISKFEAKKHNLDDLITSFKGQKRL